jgi:RNA polymerase sigma-70 factor (ECF subfamily)
MKADDLALLEAARRGEPDALDLLIKRYQAQVYRFGMKMCRDPEDAKDVLQDTLLALARGVRDFRGASSMSTWLYSVARSYCIKKHRMPKSAPGLERSLESDAAHEAARVADRGKLPDEALAERQIEQAVEQAIATLDPMYREVLILRDIEGLSAAEVAEVVGASVDAVKSRLHRARIALRANMAPLLGVPEPSTAAASSPCPDVVPLFSQFLEGEIAPDVCANLEKHLEICARCRSTCDSLKQTLALCRTSPAPVPSDVQESVRSAVRSLVARV